MTKELLLVAFLLGLLQIVVTQVIQKSLGNVSKQLEADKQDKQKFNMLVIKYLKVLGENDIEMFEALETGRTNGNLKRGKDRLSNIADEMDEYIIERASRDQ